MSVLASQIIGDSTVCLHLHKKHESLRYWPFVRGIHRSMRGFPSQRVSNAETVDDMVVRCLCERSLYSNHVVAVLHVLSRYIVISKPD